MGKTALLQRTVTRRNLIEGGIAAGALVALGGTVKAFAGERGTFFVLQERRTSRACSRFASAAIDAEAHARPTPLASGIFPTASSMLAFP